MTMTTRQALNDFADCCEAATGADRELFVQAFIAVHGRADPTRADAAEWISAWSRFSRFLDAGAFLDAAMMLVPARYRLIEFGEGVHAAGYPDPLAPWHAVMCERKGANEQAPWIIGRITGFGAQPALALTAAALRARAAMESGVQDVAS